MIAETAPTSDNEHFEKTGEGGRSGYTGQAQPRADCSFGLIRKVHSMIFALFTSPGLLRMIDDIVTHLIYRTWLQSSRIT